MNLSLFIARRVAGGGNRSFSRLIIRIAVAAVALSMTVMVVATSLITGFKTEIADKIYGFWGDIHITDRAAASDLSSEVPISTDQDFYPALDTVGGIDYQEVRSFLGQEFMTSGRTHGGIRHIQQFGIKPGIMFSRTEEEGTIMEGIVLKGIGPDFNWDFLSSYLVEGEPLDAMSDSLSSDILISEQTARRLRRKVGEKVLVNFVERTGEMPKRVMTIRGLYRTGLEEYDRQFALIDIRHVQRLNGWRPDQVNGFEVFIEDKRDLDAFDDYLHYDVLPIELYSESIRHKQPDLFEWLDIQDVNEAVILSLMLLVALINMVTALLILILERTNMIGILKALGQSDWSIRGVFLYYAAYILLLGLFWGNLLGLGICWLQDTFGIVRLDEESYYLSVAPVDVNWSVVLLLNLGTIVVTLLFLIIPSYLVSRVDPVRAIRFK